MSPGRATARQCTSCGEQKVILVYERFATRVLFCTGCEHVWTDEPGGRPPVGSERR
jgi:ribosomal protein L37AE/L43A